MGISPATLKRDTAHLRNRMNAPVVFDRKRCGYRLNAGRSACRHAVRVASACG